MLSHENTHVTIHSTCMWYKKQIHLHKRFTYCDTHIFEMVIIMFQWVLQNRRVFECWQFTVDSEEVLFLCYFVLKNLKIEAKTIRKLGSFILLSVSMIRKGIWHINHTHTRNNNKNVHTHSHEQLKKISAGTRTGALYTKTVLTICKDKITMHHWNNIFITESNMWVLSFTIMLHQLSR